MSTLRTLIGVVLTAALLVPVSGAFAQQADPPSQERVERLEAELEALRDELRAMREEHDAEMEKEGEEAPADDRLAEVERKLDALATEIERVTLGEEVVRPTESKYGLGLAASKVYNVEPGISIGGYGEMLFESFDSSRDDGSPGTTDQLDFLRAIVYFGYKFNDQWVFNSEIEFEHASTGEEGSASVEFAYLDYLWRPELNVRTGLLLVPMGFVNELHEPPMFLGARRPDVESVIIPSTWRENGFGLFGDFNGFSYRTYFVNGLEGAGFSARGLRGGRQKGSEALAEDFAWVGRLDYTGRPGLLVGGSAYVGGSGQDLRTATGESLGLDTQILEGHLEWKWRGLEVRLLGAKAELDDVADLNDILGFTGNRSVGEELEGGYLQVGYDVLAPRGSRHSLIPYLRWEQYDTQAAVPAGFAANPANDVESLTLGVAYQPIDELIFKLDWQDYDNEAGTGQDQINVAMGYLF